MTTLLAAMCTLAVIATCGQTHETRITAGATLGCIAFVVAVFGIISLAFGWAVS